MYCTLKSIIYYCYIKTTALVTNKMLKLNMLKPQVFSVLGVIRSWTKRILYEHYKKLHI